MNGENQPEGPMQDQVHAKSGFEFNSLTTYSPPQPGSLCGEEIQPERILTFDLYNLKKPVSGQLGPVREVIPNAQ
jgi:hypothetical protein